MAVIFQSDKITQIQKRVEGNLLDSMEFQNFKGNIPIPLGISESGEIIIRDFSSIPHILISGYTGSGKTAFVKTLLSVITTNKLPDDVKLAIYDTKMIDYKPFDGLNHLLFPIVSDIEKTARILEYLELEAKNRLEMISQAGCRDYKAYNEVNSKEKRLPEIIFVLDDFGSLYLDKYLTNVLLNILRNGRITGIHVIIVTSISAFSKSLYKEVLSLIPCRICFRVSSRAESRIMLEQSGAEYLCVPGEMIYKFQNDYYKCQSAYASHENIKSSMFTQRLNSNRMLLLQSAAQSLFKDLIPKGLNPSAFFHHLNDELMEDSNDEFLEDAARMIIKKQKASVGMLQREFRIGFNRAARIMDCLADYGIVGPEEGTKPRKILMNLEELEAFLHNTGMNMQQNDRTKDTITNKDPDAEHQVTLRNYKEFNIGENTLSISDNKIHYYKNIMTRLGWGHLSPSFPGSIIRGIVYKKPTLQESGFFTFKFDPDIKFDIERPDLLSIDSSNISDAIKIEFGPDLTSTICSFIKQIQEDTHVPLITL